MESTKETQAPEGPILCINNCGFFGSAATMNMCSKCHREMILKQDNAKLAASSFDDIINGGSGSGSGTDTAKDDVAADVIMTQPAATPVELNVVPVEALSGESLTSQVAEAKPKVGPSRCTTCRKKVGLTGFNCKCGNLFCATHRYADVHECSFDYRGAGRDAIAKANPVIKADKLDKI
ncbi:zinc finger A20 and AN1 domain-containing stress-associated protein 8-like [Rutidosis leptorrhynchoides]|uniref:zinc finger A20 and AN1 domain-containing stress-associated protein 8-like n=1 Tax=Rutidosis leptorrhynchoides TaxID=125765 RepID=UPI003A9A4C33